MICNTRDKLLDKWAQAAQAFGVASRQITRSKRSKGMTFEQAMGISTQAEELCKTAKAAYLSHRSEHGC